jgi:hypothetical protein
MPRICTICSHRDRALIDAAIVAQTSFRDIAGQFRIAKSALHRHRNDHLPRTLIKAKEAEEVLNASSLIKRLQGYQAKVDRILSLAQKEGDLRVACTAIGQARGIIELIGKLIGEVNEKPQINISLSPEWVRFRTVLLAALEPHPQALADVVRSLEELERPNGYLH